MHALNTEGGDDEVVVQFIQAVHIGMLGTHVHACIHVPLPPCRRKHIHAARVHVYLHTYISPWRGDAGCLDCFGGTKKKILRNFLAKLPKVVSRNFSDY